MTASRRSTRSVTRWKPPFSDDVLATVLDRLHGWTAFDDGALLGTVAAEPEQDVAAAQFIHRVRTLRVEDLSGDRRKALGHPRRMSWTVDELHERPVAARCPTEAA